MRKIYLISVLFLLLLSISVFALGESQKCDYTVSCNHMLNYNDGTFYTANGTGYYGVDTSKRFEMNSSILSNSSDVDQFEIIVNFSSAMDPANAPYFMVFTTDACAASADNWIVRGNSATTTYVMTTIQDAADVNPTANTLIRSHQYHKLKWRYNQTSTETKVFTWNGTGQSWTLNATITGMTRTGVVNCVSLKDPRAFSTWGTWVSYIEVINGTTDTTPPPADTSNPAILSFLVQATDAYNATNLTNFKVYLNNATNTYSFNSVNGVVNISNSTVPAHNNSVYDLSVYSTNFGGYHNITYKDTTLVNEVTLTANLSKYIRLYAVDYSNFSEGVDNNNYTRDLTYTINLTCPTIPINQTTLYLLINGNKTTTTNLTGICTNNTIYINDTYEHFAEGIFNISFILNSSYVTVNNTFTTINRTFKSDLYDPVIDYLNFSTSHGFGDPFTNASLRCSDTGQNNLTYTLIFNDITMFNGTLANGTLQTNASDLSDGYNYIKGICKDFFSNATSLYNVSIFAKTIYIIDEMDNTFFNMDNATGIKAYFDDNQTYIDFKTLNVTGTNFTIFDTQKLRFEFIYSSTTITRYIDLNLAPQEIRVCANKEGVTHYEQLIISASEKEAILKNVYSNCLVAADYVSFAYQNALVLKAYTIPSLYYLYTYDSNDNQIYLASLDGSIATYIDIDQLEFSQEAYNLNILGDAINFYRSGTDQVKIYYLNTQQDNIDLNLTITNMLNDEEVLSLNDFDDYNEFTIYFNYATLANITNATLFQLDLLRTTAAGQSTLTKYFNLQASSGSLRAIIAAVLAFLLTVFGLTLAATRITLSWFGIMIIIGSIVTLSLAVVTWYITLLMAMNVVVLIYICLTLTSKHYKTIT